MGPEKINLAFFKECRNRVDTALEKYLPPAGLEPKRLHSAMRYAALSQGKRVRPIFVYSAGKSVGVEICNLDQPAVAVELIHAYSLIHDDLPAMDNDDLRRGNPTCHKKFDEATAILAGDALQTLAFSVLSENEYLANSPFLKTKIINELANASGSFGMAGGQAFDIAAIGSEIGVKALENIHAHKTGALIKASIRMGALYSEETSDKQLEALSKYASLVGLAFQIRDDILDVQGNADVLGKTGGKDAASEKPTYPSLLGIQEAQDLAQQLVRQAIESLVDFDDQADPLRSIARFIIEREK